MKYMFLKGGGMLIAYVLLQGGTPENLIEWAKFGLAGLVIAALFFYVVRPVVKVHTEGVVRLSTAIELLAKNMTEMNAAHQYVIRDVKEVKENQEQIITGRKDLQESLKDIQKKISDLSV